MSNCYHHTEALFSTQTDSETICRPGSVRTRWESLKRSPRLPNWIKWVGPPGMVEEEEERRIEKRGRKEERREKGRKERQGVRIGGEWGKEGKGDGRRRKAGRREGGGFCPG